VFVVGCAAKTLKEDVNGHKASEKKSFFESSDTALIREALALLSSKEGAPDYNAAKVKLEQLVQNHPKSKWVEGAQGVSAAIDTLLLLQNKIQAEKLSLDKANTDKTKMVKENEGLKTDNLKLQQENEKLKNDIGLLKKLEIQLEKRDKMLK
jgi:FtsZ-binding cell division protein ZapB